MKYIKKFDTVSAQTEYLASAELDTYVGYVDETQNVYYDDALPERYVNKYLTFESLDDNNTFSFSFSQNSIQYSTDNGTNWNTLTTGNSITINSGDTIMWKASGIAAEEYSGIGRFSSTNRYIVYGNIMSLINGDNFANTTTISNYQFTALFSGSTGLTSAENLILPTTNLEGIWSAYYNMFRDCTNLTKAPELPATTVGNDCYYRMFYGCTNLNYIKCLATNISASSTSNWVSGVANSGTFVKAASMSSWTTGVDGIPSGWTVQNDDGSLVDDGGDDAE